MIVYCKLHLQHLNDSNRLGEGQEFLLSILIGNCWLLCPLKRVFLWQAVYCKRRYIKGEAFSLLISHKYPGFIR